MLVINSKTTKSPMTRNEDAHPSNSAKLNANGNDASERRGKNLARALFPLDNHWNRLSFLFDGFVGLSFCCRTFLSPVLSLKLADHFLNRSLKLLESGPFAGGAEFSNFFDNVLL